MQPEGDVILASSIYLCFFVILFLLSSTRLERILSCKLQGASQNRFSFAFDLLAVIRSDAYDSPCACTRRSRRGWYQNWGWVFFFLKLRAGVLLDSSSVRFWGAAKSCQRKISCCHMLEEGVLRSTTLAPPLYFAPSVSNKIIYFLSCGPREENGRG